MQPWYLFWKVEDRLFLRRFDTLPEAVREKDSLPPETFPQVMRPVGTTHVRNARKRAKGLALDEQKEVD